MSFSGLVKTFCTSRRIKLLPAFVFLMIFGFKSVSQNVIVTEKIDSLLVEAKALQTKNLGRSLHLAKAAEQLSNKTSQRYRLADIYMRMGSVFNWQGTNDSAEFYLHQAAQMRVTSGNVSGAARTFVELSNVLIETGRIDTALEVLLLADRLALQSGDSLIICKGRTDLGNFYLGYGELSKAKECFEEAITIAKRGGMVSAEIFARSGLAEYFTLKNEHERALQILIQLDSVYYSINDIIGQARNQCNIALCYTNLELPKKAIVEYRKAIGVFRENGMAANIMIISDNLARCFLATNEPDSALAYARKAYESASREHDIAMQITALETEAEALEMLDDCVTANKVLRKRSVLKDWLLDGKKVAAMSEMQTKYETEKKEQKIALLHEQGKTRTAQRNFFIAGSVVLALAFLVLTLVFVQRRRVAQKNEQIAQQRIQSLMSEQEIKTYNAMIEGQEEERKRIATDLHDRLGSMLSTVKLMFNALDSKIDKAQEANHQQFENMSDILDDAVVEVRRIAHNLNTGMVASFGLVPALEDLCESIDQNTNIRCKLLAYGMENRIANHVEIGVYRMVQEIFNNIIKHANAKTITVQLNQAEGSLNVTVEDDGVGFDLKGRIESGGMGLKNLEARAARLNGGYHIDSTPGRGTISIIEIPIND